MNTDDGSVAAPEKQHCFCSAILNFVIYPIKELSEKEAKKSFQMQRWFFADDEICCKHPTAQPNQIVTPTESPISVPDSDWLFKVQFGWKLCSNEFLAICGSCSTLGNWDVQCSLPLERNGSCSTWVLMVSLARKKDIRYRYLVYALNNQGRKIVRFWETHVGSRLISSDQLQDIQSLEHETFGLLNNKLKIERGWLSADITVVQFKFYQAPFVLNTSQAKLILHVSITPIKIKDLKKSEKLTSRTLSTDTPEHPKDFNENTNEEPSRTFAFCEVASLQDQHGEFRKQPKYGTPCGPDHLIMFNLTLDDKEHTAYLIDLYSFSSKSGSDVPLNHFGYQYVLPQDLKDSEGTLQLVIMCGAKHRPIGSMICDYLVVKPMRACDFNLEKTFQRHWNTKHEGMYIGHRGCGRSFWLQQNILRENTINSLNLAIKHGADMVEFDVQLTKDMVPILFHDVQLYVTKKSHNDLQENDIMHLPLTVNEINTLKSSEEIVEKDLLAFPLSRFTLEQLRRVKVYEPPKAKCPEQICLPENENNRPFSTLEQVLKEVDCKTGFVIDIKWPQKISDDTKQENLFPDFDKNEFVDLILQVVVRDAGSRRIIFSSFDADICAMVRLKQNLYPIMFLIQPYSNERKFVDLRGKLISTGIYFANAMELLGICINCSDILELPGNVSDLHKRDLCIFSWGKQTRTEETRKYLKALGVDGILVDRINHAVKPMDLKENLFYIVPITEPVENNDMCELTSATL